MLCYAMLCYAKSLQSCPTLCNPIDGSPPGSSVPGILRQEHWSGCHCLLRYSATVTPNVNPGGAWVKYALMLPEHFFATSCESIITSN